MLGSGSWGTALAIQFARAGKPTRLWGRDPAQLTDMRQARCNRRYLPDAPFPALLDVAPSLEAALDGVSDVLVAVPSSGFRALLTDLATRLTRDVCIAWATKGFERNTGLLPHQVAHEVLGSGYTMAVLSGPTFAREVGAGLPTAMVVASTDEAFAMRVAEDLASPGFRTYVSTDITGVEIGGAVKNVIAVGAGLSDGLGFGANMRVALITRGLNEMTRLGVALGARERTFMGLAGLGDLVLTCTDDQSRNRRCGLALSRGLSVEDAMREIGQVVEGYHAARVLRGVAARLGLDLPICEGICRILFDGANAGEVVRELMARPPQAEFE
ncbi:MAG: NAD(P)-dependent glycerol-3-phosphate dehydrogenase [Proteobacteria bacterium]|nr:NAD(P)-dependent glycerol-3-phosphate dehydrogenase [Pseudomonadota bacterium]MBK7115315.1 NAD(P)-dependent glycerol-3-phosphate dehydrogenase [Pseudomonadota bacterium]MBK9253670.1 NAD(P)-dependent glycerol-3-phosphate dehydrogenase [Pseudomonadota bacterium]MCC6630451.1 NAD(P)-dependent glycerol-3-phosphate dehydrogenase [Gammaproteobacteria bacterium]